jgi:hypothetical protein
LVTVSDVVAALETRKRGYDTMHSSASEGVDAAIESAEGMRNFIDLLLSTDENQANSARAKLTEKQYQSKSNRPENWRAIAEYAVVNGNQATMAAFPEVCLDKFGARCKTATIEMRLMRWIKDYHVEMKTNTAITINHGGRKPVYGDDIDNRILAQVKVTIVTNRLYYIVLTCVLCVDRIDWPLISLSTQTFSMIFSWPSSPKKE